MFAVFLAATSPAAGGNFDALVQLEALKVREEDTLPYNRGRDFGGWSASRGYLNCLDVRGQVLVDESLWPIMTSLPVGARCHVTKGMWIDPYSGVQIFEPSMMDVDHVVPLKEAWQSGAWQWAKSARRAYANDLTDSNHLFAVSARVNRAKGDRDPAEWLPPNALFRCRYIEIWIAIKFRWGLAVDPTELRMLRLSLQNCN